MNRPALQRLLAEVKANRIDVIVVYKVDRLTRSLADFSKIVDVLDGAGASFVSVTQAFNTTNSMGRLTLNVLLSFAQFEREVTGERIRDKIAASKKKGMWMGGPIPLGYDVEDRKLVINGAEASTVELIFERHHAAGSLRALADDLAQRGIVSKIRTMRDGRVTGGSPYAAGALRHMLRNRIYVGEISHGDLVYPGEHEAIIKRELWEASGELLSRVALRPRTGHVSVLAGRIRDANGHALMAAHAIRGEKRYRYYVSSTRDPASCWRLPAGDLESIIADAIHRLFESPERLSAELGELGNRHDIARRAQQIMFGTLAQERLRTMLAQLDASIVVEEALLHVTIDRGRLADLLDVALPENGLRDPVLLEVPVVLKRRGHELRLIYSAPDARPAQRDERLIELISKAWAAWDELCTGPYIAEATRRSHLARLARIRFLAPDIVTAILDGRQPVELTARRLLRISDLPLAWADQRRILAAG